MNKYMAILIVILLCYASCRATSNYDRNVAEFYLNTATDAIAKAKHSFPKCDKSLSRGASDCSELFQMGHNKSGVYTIWPASRITEGKLVEVYCDMHTDGGGWTLIQRRGNFQRATDYFYKDWESYKEGFGDLEKDFWLGNDFIFALTNQKKYSARFDLRDLENKTRYALYDKFWIDDENRKYTLHIADYTGDAGDSMIVPHNEEKFSTKDQDNDGADDSSCAKSYKGGWWYSACYDSNLNGLYLREKNNTKGVNWMSWKKHDSMDWTEIKIRPKKFKLTQVTLDTPE